MTLSPTPSDQELRHKALLNFLTTLVDYGGRVIVTFLLNPKILGTLGPLWFGVWQVLNRMVSYLGAPGGRPAQGLNYQMARHQHTADVGERRRLVGGALGVWLLFAPLYLLLGGAMVVLLPRTLALPADALPMLRQCLMVLVLYVMLNELGLIPCSALAGMNLKHKLLGLKVLSNLTLFVVGWLLLELGSGLVGLAVAQVCAAISLGVYGLWVARRQLPWFGADRPSKAEMAQVLRFNGGFLVWSLLDLSLKSGEVLLLGFVAGPTQVTPYTLTNFAPGLAMTFAGLVGIARMPGLAGIMGAGQHERVAHTRSETLSLIWVVMLALCAATQATNETFVTLWMGPGHSGGALLTLIFNLAALQQGLLAVDTELINATLDMRQKTKLTLAALIGSALFGYLGLVVWGLPGLAGGCVLGRLVLTLGYPALVGTTLGLSLAQQLRSVLRPALVTVLVLGGAWFLPAAPVTSWLGFLLRACVVGLVALALAFALGTPAELRRSLWQQVRARLKRGGRGVSG